MRTALSSLLIWFAASMAFGADPKPGDMKCDEKKGVGGAPIRDCWLQTSLGSVATRITQYLPDGEPIGDILFLNGFGDCAANHGELFQEMAKAGYRVIGFNYPFHGKPAKPGGPEGTRGTVPGGYANMGLEDFMQVTREVERATRENAKRPLNVAGWSTGGLVHTMISADGGYNGRKVNKCVLYAPAVAPRMLIGKGTMVTKKTLTNNPRDFECKIWPNNPLELPKFAAGMLGEALESKIKGGTQIPKDQECMVFTGGDKQDRYVVSGLVEKKVEAAIKDGATALGLKCKDSMHFLEGDMMNMTGVEVRNASLDFLAGRFPQLKACSIYATSEGDKTPGALRSPRRGQ